MVRIPKDEQCWRPGCTRKAKHKIKWNYKLKFACDGHKDDDGVHWVLNKVLHHKVQCRCKNGRHSGISTC
jgi:hypothetical protein